MVKYSAPFYDDKDDDVHHLPQPIRSRAIQRFAETFFEIFNQADMPSIERNIARLQMYLSRAEAYAWNRERLARVKDTTIPFVKLLDQAFAKDPQGMARLFAEITHPFLEAQETLVISQQETNRELGPRHTFRARFSKMHQRYVHLYETIGNVLLSAAVAAMDILTNQPIKTAKEYLNQDTGKKLERLQKTVLIPGLTAVTTGLVNHVRNAMHGGNITFDAQKGTMFLEDKSGWKEEFTEEQFWNLLHMCEETCEGLSLGYMFFDFKHAAEVHAHRKVTPPTEEEFSGLCFYWARFHGVEIERLETAGGALALEVRFVPRPRSEGAMRYGDGRVERFEEPGWNPDPVDQAIGFLLKIYDGLTKMDVPTSANIVIRRYGEEKTADFTISDLKVFVEETRGLQAKAESMDGATIEKEKERMGAKYMTFRIRLPKEAEETQGGESSAK